jgi:hypothetical protein
MPKKKRKMNKQEAEFHKLVFAKPKGLRMKKGMWDVMMGGQGEQEERLKKKKGGNFWVDTTNWFG